MNELEIEDRIAQLAKAAKTETAEVDVDALWANVRRETAQDSWRDKLRAWPTGLRVALVLGLALMFVAITALVTGVRGVLANGATTRLVLVLTALTALAAASFAVSLRGLYRPVSRGAVWTVIGLACALPVVVALTASHGVDAAGQSGLRCLLWGIASGAVVSVPVFLLQRASVPVLARAVAAAAGGGAVAYAFLELHCASRDLSHLLFGHAAVGFVLVALCAAAIVVGRRA